MALRTLNRKIKMDILKVDGDISQLLFANVRAQHACRLFLNHLKAHGGLTRSEFNQFAWDLDRGINGFRYRRGSFYKQIRKTLLTLGLIGIEQRFVGADYLELAPVRSRKKDVIDKYVPIGQPIPKRPPDGVNLVRLTWIICQKWNQEFLRNEPEEEAAPNNHAPSVQEA